MGQVYTILSQACYECTCLDTPCNVSHETVSICQGFNRYKTGDCCGVPPLHPDTPQHTRIRRKKQWYIHEKNDKRCDSETSEFAYDHENPCDICGNSNIPSKLVGSWNVCFECYQLGSD